MIEAKEQELKEVAKRYNVSFEEIVDVIKEEFKRKGLKVGMCNTGIDFFIIDTLRNNKLYHTAKRGIGICTSHAGIYWLNAANKPEYV